MRHVLLPMTTISLVLGVLSNPIPARGEVQVAGVIDAIRKDYCRDEYWGYSSAEPEQRRRVPIAVRIAGNMAHAWVENLRVIPGTPKWATYIVLAERDGETRVAYDFGYNVESLRDDFRLNTNYGHVFGPGVQMAELSVPPECTVSFEPDNALKLRMVDVVQRTIETQLTQFNKHAGANYPERTRITIANFNADYPDTYVLIQETGEVIHVVLQHGTDPFSNEYLEQGEYPSMPINADYAVSWLRERIPPIGMEREVRVGE